MLNIQVENESTTDAAVSVLVMGGAAQKASAADMME